MLKIKFNINEFTIFLRRFEGKNECKRISFSLYQFQRLPSLFFSLFFASAPFSFLQCLLFFSVSEPFLSCSPFFSGQRPFSAFVQCPLFLFCRRVALLQPKIFIFNPKRFSAQKSLFFSPIHACLSVKMKSNRLPQNQEGPAFHANSQATKKK